MSLFTFALEYPVGSADDPDVFYEEIDIIADSFTEAKRLVEEEAKRDYEPGYRRIVTLPPGGSGGFITVWASAHHGGGR